MAFDWGGFAGGMAKTWNSGAIGGAINQTVAQGREEDAVKAATEKRDQALKTLDAQRVGQPNVEVKPVQALPTQADNVGVDAVSSAGGNEMKPISDVEYEARKAAIDTDFSNAKKQARADYYKFRGMEAEQRKTEDELEQAKWHQGQVNFYKDVVAGNPQAVGKLVGYMNASMGDGTQIVQNEDGTMSLMGANGQPIQANFKPSLEQINSAFTNYYNTAKFFHDNDFEGMLDRKKTIQGMALGERAADLADKKFDFDKLMGNKNIQLKMEEVGLDREKMKQAWDIFTIGMANDNEQRALDREQAIKLQKDRQDFTAGQSDTDRKWKTEESEKDRKFKTEEAEKERKFKAEEAANERDWKTGENSADRASRESIAGEDRKVAIRGQDLRKAVDDARLAHDAADSKRKAALEAEGLEIRREEARAKDVAARQKAIDDSGLRYERSTDGMHYGYYGKAKNPVSYRTTADGPEIPIGMSENDYLNNDTLARKLGVPYTTRIRRDGSAAAVFALPDGSYTESASEAEAFMRHYGQKGAR